MSFPAVGYVPSWQPTGYALQAPGSPSIGGITPMNANNTMQNQAFNAYGSLPDMSSLTTAMMTLVSMLMTMVTQLFSGQSPQSPGQNPGNWLNAKLPQFSPQTVAGTAPKQPAQQAPAQTLPKTDGKPSYKAKATSYYPADDPIEGGFVDKKGKPLYTLQDYLDGKAPYVSVAMDKENSFAYGAKLRIPELEKKYGRQIEFRVVDTGQAFFGKGKSRIDICTRNRQTSMDAAVNGTLTLIPVS